MANTVWSGTSNHAPNSGGCEGSSPVSWRVLVESDPVQPDAQQRVARVWQGSFPQVANPPLRSLSPDGKRGAETSPSASFPFRQCLHGLPEFSASAAISYRICFAGLARLQLRLTISMPRLLDSVSRAVMDTELFLRLGGSLTRLQTVASSWR